MGEIALINSVSQRDVKNTGNVNNKVLNSKNSTVSIHGDKILQNKDVSLSSSDMFAVLSDASQRIADNANNLKEMGVPALQSVAVTVSNKAVNIISSASNECFKYDGELNKILEDSSLSPDEKKSKISLIKSKKESVIKEAEKKVSLLEKISDKLTQMAPAFLQLKYMQVDTTELTKPLMSLINGIDTAPSNLKNAKNPQDLQKISMENMNNIFGKDSQEDLQKLIKNIDKKIDKKEYQMNDKFADYFVRVRNPEVIKVLKIQKQLYTELAAMFKDNNA